MRRRGFCGTVHFVAAALVLFAVVSLSTEAAPIATIHTDLDTYYTGETIEVSLSADNPGEGMAVGVYVGLLTPDGGIYTVGPTGWTTGIVSWIPEIWVPGGFSMAATPYFWLDLPSFTPPIGSEGQYNFATLLTRAGTLDWICPLSLAPFNMGPAADTRYFVDAVHGSDSNPGLRNAPFGTVTHALAAAYGSGSNIVAIQVASGEYSPSANGEAFPLNMKSFVSIYGEGADKTTLDAEQGASHVISCNNVSGCNIRGFTITGGRAYGPGEGDDSGGGISCDASSPVISSNVIKANCAYDTGGGVSCTGGASPTIVYNAIRDNQTEGGGGAIYCMETSPAVQGNLIQDNSAAQDGGGIWCAYNSSPTIEGNTITGNSALNEGGGVCCSADALATIVSNTIAHNTATYDGGGICCLSEGVVRIEGNVITDNMVGGDGGGIYCNYSSPNILGNTLDRNSADWGGAICCVYGSLPTIADNTMNSNTATTSAGAISCYDNSSAAIVNCLIVSCSSVYEGGGINCYQSWPEISNTTIAWCSCDSEGGDGVHSSEGEATLVDCILWNDGVDLEGCSATYCCIQDLVGGAGNIHENPMFVTGPYGGYYLDPLSPCIDAGSKTASEAGLNARATRADGTPDSGTVDMGYHYPLP